VVSRHFWLQPRQPQLRTTVHTLVMSGVRGEDRSGTCPRYVRNAGAGSECIMARKRQLAGRVAPVHATIVSPMPSPIPLPSPWLMTTKARWTLCSTAKGSGLTFIKSASCSDNSFPLTVVCRWQSAKIRQWHPNHSDHSFVTTGHDFQPPDPKLFQQGETRLRAPYRGWPTSPRFLSCISPPFTTTTVRSLLCCLS